MKYFLTLIFCMALIIGGGAFYATALYRQGGPLTDTASIILPKGTGLVATANMLAAQHIIRNNYVFILAAKSKGGGGIKAGEYEFAAGTTMEQVLDKMIKGDVVHRRFTIPEGRTSFEIVHLLNQTERLTGTVTHFPAEGSLLPETYDYQTGDTRQKKIDEMAAAMNKTLATLWTARAPDCLFKTPEEAVTLASIVEKETGKASERKTIAGVFLNRLKIGMPLQSDPTVIYALTNGQPQNDGEGPLGRRLLSKDLETPSPYNTYQNIGLPPGPIANPGKDALEAVMHPETHKFLYFVADGTGGHVFAQTLEEHNRNVAAWRKIRH